MIEKVEEAINASNFKAFQELFHQLMSEEGITAIQQPLPTSKLPLLHCTSFLGQTEFVDLILQYPVDTNASVREGKFTGFTPLTLTVASDYAKVNVKHHHEVVKMLIQKGADVNGIITAGKLLGWTPLHFAAGAGLGIIIQCLLEKGARTDREIANGLRKDSLPMNLAKKNRHNPYVPLLNPELPPAERSIIFHLLKLNALIQQPTTTLEEVDAVISAGADLSYQKFLIYLPLYQALKQYILHGHTQTLSIFAHLVDKYKVVVDAVHTDDFFNAIMDIVEDSKLRNILKCLLENDRYRSLNIGWQPAHLQALLGEDLKLEDDKVHNYQLTDYYLEHGYRLNPANRQFIFPKVKLTNKIMDFHIKYNRDLDRVELGPGLQCFLDTMWEIDSGCDVTGELLDLNSVVPEATVSYFELFLRNAMDGKYICMLSHSYCFEASLSHDGFSVFGSLLLKCPQYLTDKFLASKGGISLTSDTFRVLDAKLTPLTAVLLSRCGFHLLMSENNVPKERAEIYTDDYIRRLIRHSTGRIPFNFIGNHNQTIMGNTLAGLFVIAGCAHLLVEYLDMQDEALDLDVSIYRKQRTPMTLRKLLHIKHPDILEKLLASGLCRHDKRSAHLKKNASSEMTAKSANLIPLAQAKALLGIKPEAHKKTPPEILGELLTVLFQPAQVKYELISDVKTNLFTLLLSSEIKKLAQVKSILTPFIKTTGPILANDQSTLEMKGNYETLKSLFNKPTVKEALIKLTNPSFVPQPQVDISLPSRPFQLTTSSHKMFTDAIAAGFCYAEEVKNAYHWDENRHCFVVKYPSSHKLTVSGVKESHDVRYHATLSREILQDEIVSRLAKHVSCKITIDDVGNELLVLVYPIDGPVSVPSVIHESIYNYLKKHQMLERMIKTAVSPQPSSVRFLGRSPVAEVAAKTTDQPALDKCLIAFIKLCKAVFSDEGDKEFKFLKPEPLKGGKKWRFVFNCCEETQKTMGCYDIASFFHRVGRAINAAIHCKDTEMCIIINNDCYVENAFTRIPAIRSSIKCISKRDNEWAEQVLTEPRKTILEPLKTITSDRLKKHKAALERSLLKLSPQAVNNLKFHIEQSLAIAHFLTQDPHHSLYPYAYLLHVSRVFVILNEISRKSAKNIQSEDTILYSYRNVLRHEVSAIHGAELHQNISGLLHCLNTLLETPQLPKEPSLLFFMPRVFPDEVITNACEFLEPFTKAIQSKSLGKLSTGNEEEETKLYKALLETAIHNVDRDRYPHWHLSACVMLKALIGQHHQEYKHVYKQLGHEGIDIPYADFMATLNPTGGSEKTETTSPYLISLK